jgi:protein-tyrosine-phosphatase
MKVLFACKHNRFRSKVAEAVFNKLIVEKDKGGGAVSGGLLLDEKRPYVEQSVKDVLSGKGLEVVSDKPRQLTLRGIEGFDKIVFLGDGVKESLFCDRAEVEIWEIEDTGAGDIEKIGEIVRKIEEKVGDLVERI